MQTEEIPLKDDTGAHFYTTVEINRQWRASQIAIRRANLSLYKQRH